MWFQRRIVDFLKNQEVLFLATDIDLSIIRPFLMQYLLIVYHMITQRRQHICEHFKDSHDKNPHNNPFSNLLGQGVLDNATKAKAENSNDDRDNNRGPDHEAFAIGADIHLFTAILT